MSPWGDTFTLHLAMTFLCRNSTPVRRRLTPRRPDDRLSLPRPTPAHSPKIAVARPAPRGSQHDRQEPESRGDHSRDADHRLRPAPRRPARRQAGPRRWADRPHAHVPPAPRRRSTRGGGPGAARGFKKGDVLAIYSPNLPEYGLAMLGAASLGAHHHHRQSALHGRRAGQAARGLEGAAPRDGRRRSSTRRRKAAAKAGGIEEIFVFGDGRRRPAVRRAACSTATSRPPSPSTRATTSSCCRTRAAPRACPRA